MAEKTGNTKLKLLYILDLLNRESDEKHPITTVDFITMLESKGISSERKSIYTDISALIDFGYDIVKTRTPKSGWYIGKRVFEVPEICLLSDAVQSAAFISNERTAVLIEKLESLTSANLAQSIQNRVYVDSSVKCENSDIFYTIDKLHTAINSGKKVNFAYDKRNICNNGIRITNRYFRVSPYAMIWNNDHYYLICNNEKYDNLMHTRIDRIHHLEILEEKARPFSEVSVYEEKFDCADYANKVFGMFSGELEQVELVCDNSLIDVMLDRFGRTARIYKYSPDEFRIVFNAALSKGLVNWILQHGSAVQILKPQRLQSMYLNEVKEITARYDG